MLNSLFTSRKIFVFLLAMGATALLGACGGGGGGSGYPDISYTGVQTEAVIDQTNAADFPFVMLEGGSGSGDVFENLPLGAGIDPEATGGVPDPENIKKAADVIIDLIKNQLGKGTLVTGASQANPGNCGGEAVLSGSDTGSLITASLKIDNFCEYDSLSGITVKMHGLMNISISYTGDYNFTDFIMSITYLKMSVSDGVTTVSEEFAGTIEITGIDTSSPTFSVSVNFKYAGKVFKIVNLAIVEDMSTNSISISGTVYHPVHGYVVITTDVADPFEYYPTKDQFCNGTLRIVGSDGAVPPGTGTVTVDFTADSTCSTYDICVQVNTDPQICAYDVPWGTEPWPIPAVPAPAPGT